MKDNEGRRQMAERRGQTERVMLRLAQHFHAEVSFSRGEILNRIQGDVPAEFCSLQYESKG